MTNDEAIKRLKEAKGTIQPFLYVNEAIDYAVRALEQEPCEDAISRQAMHIELEKWITYGEYKYSNATKYLYDRIDRLPPVTPQPKTGRWIKHLEPNDAEPFVLWLCESCDTVERRKTPYCPCCGAKMESEE